MRSLLWYRVATGIVSIQWWSGQSIAPKECLPNILSCDTVVLSRYGFLRYLQSNQSWANDSIRVFYVCLWYKGGRLSRWEFHINTLGCNRPELHTVLPALLALLFLYGFSKGKTRRRTHAAPRRSVQPKAWARDSGQWKTRSNRSSVVRLSSGTATMADSVQTSSIKSSFQSRMHLVTVTSISHNRTWLHIPISWLLLHGTEALACWVLTL